MDKSKDYNKFAIEPTPFPVAASAQQYDPCSIAHIDVPSGEHGSQTEETAATYVLGESSTLGSTILSLREWLKISLRLLKDQMTRRKMAERQIQEKDSKLSLVFEGICRALNAILSTKDPYTALHQEKVAKLATAIALQLGLSINEIAGIRIGGLLHDIGKIIVPAEILNKSGKLSDHEFGLIREHPQVGYTILRSIEFPWDISRIVLQHHERLDGSGYPRGLRGDNILFGAKILSVADVVEAVSAHRPYREAQGIADALRHIQHHRNVLYDSSVVEACLFQFYQSDFSF